MLRSDILWLMPAVLIAIYQVFWLWRRLPDYREEDTALSGRYTSKDLIRFNFLRYVAYCFFIFQLGFVILPMSDHTPFLIFLRLVGYLMIFSGLIISKRALKVLADNWSGMFVYRIKKGQKLITDDVYSFIRHPIYLAVILEATGFELIANSWLFLAIFFISFGFFQYQIMIEEELLEKKFGESYSEYKKSVKKIFPFIF